MFVASMDKVIEEDGSSSEGSESSTLDKLVKFEPEELDKDLYGVGISALIRDMHKLVMGEGRTGLRTARAFATVFVLWANIGLQLFLMFEFKKLVTSDFVHRIRATYGEYEAWMYENHTLLTVNGFDRGIPGFFNPARFEDLPETIDKEFICSIPFSQGTFCFCILTVWTLAVVIDLRKIQYYIELLVIRTPTLDSPQKILVIADAPAGLDGRENKHKVKVLGLTRGFKVMLLVFLILPRLAIDIVLLWLGCRWLVATANFGDLLMNAIALEFILLFKELMYNAVTPKHTMTETAHFEVPDNRELRVGWLSYMGSFLWLGAVFLWVYLYMHLLQQVLPEYRWDIHTVCEPYITQITALTNDGGTVIA